MTARAGVDQKMKVQQKKEYIDKGVIQRKNTPIYDPHSTSMFHIDGHAGHKNWEQDGAFDTALFLKLALACSAVGAILVFIAVVWWKSRKGPEPKRTSSNRQSQPQQQQRQIRQSRQEAPPTTPISRLTTPMVPVQAISPVLSKIPVFAGQAAQNHPPPPPYSLFDPMQAHLQQERA